MYTIIIFTHIALNHTHAQIYIYVSNKMLKENLKIKRILQDNDKHIRSTNQIGRRNME